MDWLVCHYFFVTTIIVLPSGLAHNSTLTTSEYKRLLNISDTFIATHRKTIQPPISGDIDILFLLFTFVDLDESEDRLTMVMNTFVRWKYETLEWENVDDHDRYITFSENDVWFPFLRLVNVNSRRINADIHPDMGAIWVGSSGMASMMITKTTETHCSVDVTHYPFDKQACDIIVNVRTGDRNLSIMQLERILDYKNKDNLWYYKKFKVKTYYDLGGVNILFRLFLERKPAWAIVNLILPIFILVSLSPLVFLLSKDGSERVGLSLTILLAVSVYMTLISDQLPISSDPLPFLTVVLFVWYASNTTVVLLVIFNSRIYKLHESKPIPVILKRFVIITRKVFCQAKINQTTRITEGEEELNGSESMVMKSYSNGNDCNEDKQTDQPEPSFRGTMASVKWSHVSSALDKWMFVLIYVLKIIFAVYVFHEMQFGQPEYEPYDGEAPEYWIEPWLYESPDLA